MNSVASISSHNAAAAANLAASGKAAGLKNLPQADQIKAAAGQFEAIILRQLLQDSMSKLAGGEQSGGGMYSYMMTDVMANKLTEGGGLGLAKVFEQQLAPRTSKATAALDAKGIK
jgi:flagellar protein FlgJ